MDLSDSRAPNSGTCVGTLRRFVIALTPKCASDYLHGEWAAECIVYGLRRHWSSIVVITASAPALTFERSPNPDLSRAEQLRHVPSSLAERSYARPEIGRAHV